MALVPNNTNFITGDILTASQYNETHNTAVKLALEDNSRVVLPGSNAPTNISNGHWVLGAIAGNYINFNGVGEINTPSVFLYDASTTEWLVYPLVNTAINTDYSLTVWDEYTYYVASKDFVYYVNPSSTDKSFKTSFVYKCNAATTPTQSPESHPAKWSRAGVYIDESVIIALGNDVATLSANLSTVSTQVALNTTAISNLQNTDIALGSRIDDVENLISTLGVSALATRVSSLEAKDVVLESSIAANTSDIVDLSSNFDGLQTTLLGAITSLTLRVNTAESEIDVLQGDMETLNQNMSIIGQEFDVVKATVEAFPSQLETLTERVDAAEINIGVLDSTLSALATTTSANRTLLDNTIVRVTQAEVDIDELQNSLNSKSDISHTHADLYEPKNINIQSHINTSNIHFTQSEIVITKSQISDLDLIVPEETDPIFTASPAVNITTDHITVLNNTSGINTGDQDLSGLSPLVHTHVEADIADLDKYTKVEVDAFINSKADAIHTHTESSIIDLDKYTKAEVDALISAAGGDLIEAPIDGKQYARQDGAWAEVIGGSSEVVNLSNVEVYDASKPNDDGGYAYYAGNTFVSYLNLDSPDPQFQAEALYRCTDNALTGESPETNPEKWIYQGIEVTVTNDNTGIVVAKTEADLYAITGYKHGDNVILLTSGEIYFYNEGASSGIQPNDNTSSFGRWVIDPTLNTFNVKQTVVTSAGTGVIVVAGREIIHTFAEGNTTLTVSNGIAGTYTKIQKTLLLLDNSANSQDVAVTWPSAASIHYTSTKPAYIKANSVVKVEVVAYGVGMAVYNIYTLSEESAGINWTAVRIDSAITTSFNALPSIIYLVDASTAPVTAILPDATSGNIDEFKFVLDKDTHKLTITTVGGIQEISGYTSQIIPTLKGSLEIKCNGTGYDITDDSRSTVNVVELTANRDFGVDNFENNFLYLVKPEGGSISLTLPAATSITGGIAIVSRFQLEGTGDFTITATTGLIGDAESQTVNVTGTGFDIVWYESKYYIQNDNRPKTTSATVTTYPMNEDSTIIDSVTGTYFKQRCASTECPGFDAANSTLTSTTITAASGDAFQCTSSSLIAGSMIGSIPVGNIEIYYNSYKTGSVNIEIYVEYSKRTVAGVETVIGTSAVGTVTSATLTQLRLVAQHIAFDITETDYLVVRTYARKATTGTNPVLNVTVEGSNATRSTMEIGASSIAHNTLAGRGAANSHPASAIQLASGEDLEDYLAANTPNPPIVSATAWDGTTYNIDLSAGAIVWKTVNDLVATLEIGTTFDTDASTTSKVAMLIIDNSANTSAITTMTFNGTWYWPLGVQPLGLAAGAIAILQVRNIAGTIVLPTYFIKA